MVKRLALLGACVTVLLSALPAAASVYTDFLTQTTPVIYWNQNETSGTTATDLAAEAQLSRDAPGAGPPPNTRRAK